GEFQKTVDGLNRAVDAYLARLDAGDLEGAKRAQAREISPLIEQADSVLERLIKLNAKNARELGLEIGHARRRVARISYALHALAAGFALLLMALSFRAARQQLRLIDERNRLAERRAEELELFAGRVAHDIKNPLGALALRVVAAQRDASDERAREGLAR